MLVKILTLKIFLFVSISMSFAGGLEDIQEAVAKGGPDKPFTMSFSDGFEQKVKGPFKLVKSDIRYRCPCADYTFSFYDDKGFLQTRKLHHKQLSGMLEYSSEDGSQKYILSSFKAGALAEKQPCQLVGKMEKINIQTKKILPRDGKMCPMNGVANCLGDKLTKCEGKMKCRGDKKYPDDTYGIYCMATESGCPTAYECAADEALDKYVADAKENKLQIIETDNKGVRK